MENIKQLIIDFIDIYGDKLLTNKYNNPLIDNLVKRIIGEKNTMYYCFFLWFRENGEKYINKSIEEMITIYEKESNNH